MHHLLAAVFTIVYGLAHCAPQGRWFETDEVGTTFEVGTFVEGSVAVTSESHWKSWDGWEDDSDADFWSDLPQYYNSTIHTYTDYDYPVAIEVTLSTESSPYCQESVRDDYVNECLRVLEKDYKEVIEIKDKYENTKGLCCVVEDYHGCIWRAMHYSNCVTDSEALKENLESSRSFFLAINNVTTCAEFENKCTEQTGISGADPAYVCHSVVFLVLALVTVLFAL